MRSSNVQGFVSTVLTLYEEEEVLFSDTCGGQNREHMMIIFLSLLSEWLQIEIRHFYPVRGHSYCLCDRNFGKYEKEITKTETIETKDDYIKILKGARNPPFTVLKWGYFDIFLIMKRLSKKDAKFLTGLPIKKAMRINYFPNGEVHVFNDYKGEFKRFIIEKLITAANIFEDK